MVVIKKKYFSTMNRASNEPFLHLIFTTYLTFQKFKLCRSHQMEIPRLQEGGQIFPNTLFINILHYISTKNNNKDEGFSLILVSIQNNGQNPMIFTFINRVGQEFLPPEIPSNDSFSNNMKLIYNYRAKYLEHIANEAKEMTPHLAVPKDFPYDDKNTYVSLEFFFKNSTFANTRRISTIAPFTTKRTSL